ncbi:MAG: MFS transporter [Spirochaetia bacterium]
MKAPEKISKGKMILFAFGALGWSLLSFSPANLLNYFYFPPETGEGTVFPVFIFQGAVIGVLTILGIISFAGRAFDAVTDPVIAGISDRSNFRFGRRRTFMLTSAPFFTLFSLLPFVPLRQTQDPVNSIWLAVSLFLFYLFFTMYMVPYSAMIPELGRTSKDRLFICTIGSVGWALGFFFGNSIYAVKDLLTAAGFSDVSAFQTGIGLFILFLS